MFINYLEPSDGHGLDVVLHWIGPGWYGPIQEMEVIHEYPIYGYDKDGFSKDGEARIWDLRRGLGTPHWLDSVENYSGYEKAEA